MKKLIQISVVALTIFVVTPGAIAQTSLTVTEGAAVMDGVLSPGEYSSQTMVTALGVSLQAMGDDEFLYLVAQWADKSGTESINKNMWTFDGATWTKSGNEDRFSFVWDMGLNGADGAKCGTMCHFASQTMGTTTGAVDVWHWKAARGGTTNGVVDDKWWFTEVDGRHSDAGTSAYSNNDLVSGNPTSMPQGGPGAGAVFLAKDQAALDLMTPIASHTVGLAVAFDPGAGWANGDTVPGYVLRVPSGGRASVESRATYDNGTWTVEFKKPYAGNVSDFTVVPGSSVSFTHEIFDNEGHAHPDDGFDTAVYTLDFSTLVQSKTLAVAPGAATLDGQLSDGEWTSAPLQTLAGVTMYSMADGDNLYVAAQWPDASGTESVNKNLWTFDGATWTKSGNEDRFGIIWDKGLNGADGADCTTMCHSSTMGTSTGIVDVWHWKAARGGTALGFTDDKYWTNEVDGRKSDSGTSAYSDNALVSGNPTFMQAGGPATPAVFLASDQAALDIMTPMTTHASALAVSFDPGAGWANGNTVPGYVLRVPSGDRASVQSASSYDNGIWTVEFKKPYAGGDHDFEVVPGSTVDFSHEIFDNTGSGHINDGWDGSVYTLDLALITGIERLFAAEIPSAFSLEQNYPNPFNPSTNIRFSLTEPQRVALTIYDPLGRMVKVLIDDDLVPGSYEVNFTGTNLASGIYFYKLTARNNVQTRKMILLK